MHRVFISYHHDGDQYYKNELSARATLWEVFDDQSVNTGDLTDDLEDETIRQRIRDEYLRDTTVTIVLVGQETRKRKHVDWEIYSSMIDGSKNNKSGILVVNLPTVGGTCCAAHTNEKASIYPEITSWTHFPSREDCERLHPFAPARIVDNLFHSDAKVSVTTWNKIEDQPDALRLLVNNAFDARTTNKYDLSTPMRRHNS